MNNKSSIVAGVVLICAAGTVVAQFHPSSGTGNPVQTDPAAMLSASKRPLALTPALKAKLDRIWQLNQAAAAELDAGDYAQSEADARLAISVGPDALGEELLASSLNTQGKTAQALRAYQTIADEGDDQPRNLLPYALMLLKAGHWAQAVASYDKQLPYLAEGDLMIANSHFSSAVSQPEQLETAIHIALGLTYGAADSWGKHSQADRALAELQKAQALTPNSALAYLYEGHQLKQMGRGVEAQAAYQKAAQVGQGDVKAAALKEIQR